MGKYFEKVAISRALLFRAAQKAEQKAMTYAKLEQVPRRGLVVKILDSVNYKRYKDQAARFLAVTHQKPRAKYNPLSPEHAKEMAAQAKRNKVPGDPGKMAVGEHELKKSYSGDVSSKIKGDIKRGLPFGMASKPSTFWD